MGTITLKVPQDIHMEYQIDSSKMMEPSNLLKMIDCYSIPDKYFGQKPVQVCQTSGSLAQRIFLEYYI